jgi:hypothetical protein
MSILVQLADNERVRCRAQPRQQLEEVGERQVNELNIAIAITFPGLAEKVDWSGIPFGKPKQQSGQ